MKQSPLFSLNLNDLLKGLIMAVLTPVMVVVEQTIEKGSLNFDWHLISIAAAGGFVAYIVKNWLTPMQPTQTVTQNAQGTVTKTEIQTDNVDVNVSAIK